jgi:hypothetical protein
MLCRLDVLQICKFMRRCRNDLRVNLDNNVGHPLAEANGNDIF